MRYWSLLLAKLAASAGVLWAVWLLIQWLLPAPRPFLYYRHQPFGHDLWFTVAVLGYWLFAVGLLYLVVLDQRFRCRTCARRLRMPVRTGSWSQMFLLAPPRTEYICPYGHGTYRVPEVQLTGLEPTHWKANDDIWKELENLEATKK